VEDNPFETYATLLEEGSVIEGKVLRKVEKGAEIVFENLGVEAFVPSRHMVKEDGSELAADERIDFRIIEFNPDARRVVASHTELHKQVKADKQKADRAKAQKAVKVINSNVERSTLGDLDALSKLKEQMEDDEKNG
jgi:small subunit ribosomal protein S1